MRSRNENNDISIHAIAGTRVVILGLDLKHKDDESGDSSPSTTLSAMLSGLTVAEDANGPAEPLLLNHLYQRRADNLPPMMYLWALPLIGVTYLVESPPHSTLTAGQSKSFIMEITPSCQGINMNIQCVS